MVFVNSKKFACESCIKGHRSSSCHHADRPLFEIKKKGRPVSQCEKCRELRQSKKVHSKCTCTPKTDPASRGEVLASTTSKSRRFIPIVPALPNGLKDILAASQTSLPADARQRVDSLLNPCNCRSVWKCNCRQSQSPATADQAASLEDLDILAHVATMRRHDPPIASSPLTPLDRTAKTALPRTISLAPRVSSKRHASRPSSPLQDTYKRSKHHHHHHCHKHNHNQHSPSPALELPPIQSLPESTLPLTNQVPDFGFMPPITTINSLAGSGCTCGIHCACPGCVVHRGSQHAAKDLQDCTDGECRTCVDNQSGVALQSSTSPLSSISGGSTATLGYLTKSASLTRFFARAAALPPPPQYRRLGNGIQLDPREVRYNTGKTPPVNLPKLECCGGRCSCPNGQCGCGTACGGCCAHTDSSTPSAQVPLEKDTGACFDLLLESEVVPLTPSPQGSCCAGTPS